MPTLSINGKEITVEKGTTVIQAAEKLGVDIPRYCYHPGLSIAGNCRMCLVEIEKIPKLQISCHIQCTDGMVVRTETDKVKKTREHILEFLLVNHPLDCPVCDQSGECWLQDYYMDHGLYNSRLDETKVKKKKAQPIGPHVMLDSERCILCSRCVRYADEITKTNEFGIFNRGDRSEIGLYPGKELDNKYSGNVVDICPVGALTDREFRFKCRVWYLKKTESVCNQCSRGCNISMEVNTERPQHGHGERVMRVKPSYQPLVNQWWMCDQGRYGYHWIDQGRILEPARRFSVQPEVRSWDEMIPQIAERIQIAVEHSRDEVAVLLSPVMSNEALYLAKKFFVETLHLPHVELFSPNPDGDEDDFLIRADKHPNRKGAEILGFKEDPKKIESLIAKAKEGRIKVLYLFGQDLITRIGEKAAEAIQKIGIVIFHGTNVNLTSENSKFVLPAAAYAETHGSFTNFEGKVQEFSQAILPIGNAKSDLEILLLIAGALGVSWLHQSPADIMNEMKEKIREFREVLPRTPIQEQEAHP